MKKPAIIVQVSIVGLNDADGAGVAVMDDIMIGHVGMLAEDVAKEAVERALKDWQARR